MTDLMETILTPVSEPPAESTPSIFHGLKTIDGAIFGTTSRRCGSAPT